MSVKYTHVGKCPTCKFSELNEGDIFRIPRQNDELFQCLSKLKKGMAAKKQFYHPEVMEYPIDPVQLLNWDLEDDEEVDLMPNDEVIPVTVTEIQYKDLRDDR